MVAASLPGGRRLGPDQVVIAFAAAGWLSLNLFVLALASGAFPFDRPNLAASPFWLQAAMPSLALVEQILLMGFVRLLTPGRDVRYLATLAPEAPLARRETAGLLAYALAAQAGGWILGPLFGYRPFSFHLAGSLVGCSHPPSPGEAYLWCGYNFLAYAVLPFVWARRRYGLRELALVFTRPASDVGVILAVLLVEGSVQLAVMPAILKMPWPVLIKAGPLAFALFFFGTVLPTMVLVYALLLPRYLKLTGSVPLSVVLGGLTYAGMHLVEGWSSFSGLREGVLSILFVFVSYAGPGMFKSYITLRTGNAWSHALAYHAVAPHVIGDAPLIAQAFHITA